ncbi:unnamed protein product [Rhizophagus irregularis]|uniref:Uncharacterized protein n=1 Tax=Rhizophagus irregularis TaxID=588596 RepID=A0A915ZN17_9GLOM|nr:unnamed protein product [Rhizophagus irregularis]
MSDNHLEDWYWNSFLRMDSWIVDSTWKNCYRFLEAILRWKRNKKFLSKFILVSFHLDMELLSFIKLNKNKLLQFEIESPDYALVLLSDNETESSVKLVNKKPKTSWVWAYWDEEIREVKGVLRQVIVCKVIDTANQIPCRKTYIKSSGSISNAINHLRNKHDITKNGKIVKVG